MPPIPNTKSDRMANALDLVNKGFHVLPLHTSTTAGCSCRRPDCDSIGKHPRTRNGLNDASTDAEQIWQWWQRWPDANIGVRTGGGVVLLDIDADKEGYESLQSLEAALGALPHTLCARTGGGGEHRYFREPAGTAIPNSVGRLGKGLDVRGERGYAVAPPSRHASGAFYTFLDETAEMAELPAAWIAETTRRDPTTLRDRPGPAASDDGATGHGGGRGLEREIDAVRNAAVGTRNDCLNRSAFRAGQLVTGGHLAEDDAHDALLRAALDSGLPQSEAERTLRSGLGAGKQAPPLAGLAGVRMLTDMGNAERLADRHGAQLRYVQAFRRFYVWDGSRFRPDDTGRAEQLAKDTVRSIYSEASLAPDSPSRTKIASHGVGSERATRIRAMLDVVRSEQGIGVRPEELDRDPWKLNVANGTIDLRTGVLHPHDPADLITKLSPVAYDPGASCPTFESFLDRVMGGNDDLIRFLQRAAGYTLTADIREQVLFFFYGTGANGKTTFLNTLLAVLGEYGRQADPELLVSKRGDVHPTGVADLAGARLAVCTEVEQGKRLAEALVKQLTGGDRIKARFMRGDFFEFEPSHKLLLAANHKPVIRGIDHAIWRRILLIPFNVTIPDAEQDKDLPGKLRDELPGILAWAVRGCLTWQQIGLAPPDEVRVATNTYRAEMDTIGDFIAERCTVGDGERVMSKDVYSAYTDWCEGNGERPLSQRALGMRLAERGFQGTKDHAGRWWEGLSIPTYPF